MKLSIVITTRNRINDLLKCINSLKNSYFPISDWELIIIDDNSVDDTAQLKFSETGVRNGKIIHNKEKQMMVKSRNIGAKEAQGNYILFIDDDNIIDSHMVACLLAFAENNDEYGMIGPSMYYLKNKKKYMDYQKINFFTGKTTGVIDVERNIVCNSDGIPNVFMIKKKVFEECGYFDENLIQTFTEPDFCFNARKKGYKCGIVKAAKTFHNVTEDDRFMLRGLGGQFKQKAYCTMRNRALIISRYGTHLQKIIFINIYIFWPLVYSLLVLKHKRFDLVKLYWIGYLDGLKFFFTDKINKSIP